MDLNAEFARQLANGAHTEHTDPIERVLSRILDKAADGARSTDVALDAPLTSDEKATLEAKGFSVSAPHSYVGSMVRHTISW